MVVLRAAELQQFLFDAFPAAPPPYVVESVDDVVVRLRLPVTGAHERPGGTVSGPSLMALADCAAYVAVAANIGPVALAVTTSLHIDFLRKPAIADVIADATVLKVGRRLAVVDVAIRSLARHGTDRNEADPLAPTELPVPDAPAASGDLVAKAQVTYSIPPGQDRTGGRAGGGGPPTPPASA